MLKEQLSLLVERWKEEVGSVVITPLSSLQQEMERVFSNLVQWGMRAKGRLGEWAEEISFGYLFRENFPLPRREGGDGDKEPKGLVERLKALQKAGSSWGIYATLNLEGLKKENDARVKRAIRFSHFIVGEGKVDFSPESLWSCLQKVFKEHPFPWEAGEDPRMASLQWPEEGQVIDVSHGGEVQSVVKDKNKRNNAPVIIIGGDNEDDNQRVVGEYLDERPFVFFVKRLDDQRIAFQLLANHEFFDGVPAAYYLRQYIDMLGLHLGEVDEDVLAIADRMENRGQEGDYQVCSVVLSDELTKGIVSLFGKVKQKLADQGIGMSFEAFIQLFILYSHGVNGQEIRGGLLKFNPSVREQLEHYQAGNVKRVWEIIGKNGTISDEEKVELQQMGFLFTTRYGKNKIGAFRRGYNNINNFIRPLQELVPVEWWPFINRMSKVMGVARAATGQVMVSVVPETMKIAEREVNLGGVGGPALTEYMDVAYTVSIKKGEDGEVERIIVRVKAKSKKDREK